MPEFNSAREISESIARKQHEQRVRVDSQGRPLDEPKPRQYDGFGRLIPEPPAED